MIKVSVIIPIYNVEHFITRCATSLLEQTMKDVEFIFVDDVTPDKSIHLLQEVLGHYPERKEQVKLIRHVTNQGLPAARNSGLAVASGEYIFHYTGQPKSMMRILFGATGGCRLKKTNGI